LEAQRLENGSRDSLTQTRHQLAELVAEREAFERTWSSDLRKELVVSQNALDAASAQLEKARLHKTQVELKAEEDAIILTVAKTSVGSVLREGELIFSATPLNAALVAEAHILARDVGFVRAGDHVTLKVDAFNFTEHGTAAGVVEWISEGAFFLNEETNQPVEAFYKARVKMTKMNFIHVPDSFRLIPGMSLVADINVGQRSLARYLIDGLVRGASEAMREP
jgi:HlyD family secretion protein